MKNKLVGNVFDLLNKFHDNQTRFGGYMKKNLWGLFWLFLGSSSFRPLNFHQEVSIWSRNFSLFCMGNPKKWTQDDLLIPSSDFNLGVAC